MTCPSPFDDGPSSRLVAASLRRCRIRSSQNGLAMPRGASPSRHRRERSCYAARSPAPVLHKPFVIPQGKRCDEWPGDIIIVDGTESLSARDTAAPLPPPRAPRTQQRGITGAQQKKTSEAKMLRERAKRHEYMLQQMAEDPIYGRGPIRPDGAGWRMWSRSSAPAADGVRAASAGQRCFCLWFRVFVCLWLGEVVGGSGIGRGRCVNGLGIERASWPSRRRREIILNARMLTSSGVGVRRCGTKRCGRPTCLALSTWIAKVARSTRRQGSQGTSRRRCTAIERRHCVCRARAMHSPARPPCSTGPARDCGVTSVASRRHSFGLAAAVTPDKN